MPNSAVRRFAAAFIVVAACANHPAHAQYQQVNLVSDDTTINPALRQDANLINAWGISASPAGPFWVSAADAGKSTLYNTAGVPQTLVVNIPNAAGQTGPGSPTGQVFSGGADFRVSNAAGAAGPARFIFATEQGTISGWNPGVNPTNAILTIDNSANNASYKGLALASNGANHLYAADIFNGRIDVFDGTYAPTTLTGSFADPTAPLDYHPFNIQNLGGELYVTYAKTETNSAEEIKGDGFGFVSVFDTNGNFLRRLASGTDAGGTLTDLNAPWGLALAPADFGAYSGDVLVGNFGSGKILAFDKLSGALTGVLGDTQGNPLIIDGLWGLQPGNGGNGGAADKVYFAAGPNDETHGLFGSLQNAAPEPGVLPLMFCGLPILGLAARRFRRR